MLYLNQFPWDQYSEFFSQTFHDLLQIRIYFWMTAFLCGRCQFFFLHVSCVPTTMSTHLILQVLLCGVSLITEDTYFRLKVECQDLAWWPNS